MGRVRADDAVMRGLAGDTEIGEIQSCLTTHSSRRRFAARLNSGCYGLRSVMLGIDELKNLGSSRTGGSRSNLEGRRGIDGWGRHTLRPAPYKSLVF